MAADSGLLQRVEITQEVLLSCMTHAFTTESEEIMGLLLGDIMEEQPGMLVSRIWMAYPQIRTDRRKDRVETSPEQMARCSAHAERLSRETGQRVRVVGWYHSHPHITVLPSHIDVRTQAMYQMLDPGFVGLILSVFNTDSSSKAGQVQVTAFQSVPAGSPEAARGTPGGSGGNQGGLQGGELVSYSSEALAGLDTPTKEAIRASAAAHRDSTAGALVRREVPLHLVKGRSANERSLHDLVVVHRILAMEEKQAYEQATKHRDSHAAPAAASAPKGPSALSPASLSPADSPRKGGPAGASAQQQGFGGAGPTGPASAGAALAQLHAASCHQQGVLQFLETVLSASLLGLTSLATQQALQTAQLQAQVQQLKDLVAARTQQRQQQIRQAQQQQEQQLLQMQNSGSGRLATTLATTSMGGSLDAGHPPSQAQPHMPSPMAQPPTALQQVAAPDVAPATMDVQSAPGHSQLQHLSLAQQQQQQQQWNQQQQVDNLQGALAATHLAQGQVQQQQQDWQQPAYVQVVVPGPEPASAQQLQYQQQLYQQHQQQQQPYQQQPHGTSAQAPSRTYHQQLQAAGAAATGVQHQQWQQQQQQGQLQAEYPLLAGSSGPTASSRYAPSMPNNSPLATAATTPYGQSRSLPHQPTQQPAAQEQQQGTRSASDRYR